MKKQAPIGIFDSGYGGLTVLKELVSQMPQYDFIYLGDNARAPYGNRSFETIHNYTLQAVQKLFDMGCHLVILACNTASAKALRTIQQNDLPVIAPEKRVLGVIRPSVEAIAAYTKTKHIGVLGTRGTVLSDSYPLEIKKLHDHLSVQQEACPMWVPIVEYGEANTEGADYFIKKNIDSIFAKDKKIDTLILACTHYPILYDKIKKYSPKHITILSQGKIVSEKLIDYLKRHPEMDQKCSKKSQLEFFTTESPNIFNNFADTFCGHSVIAQQIEI